jgi:hypothetical protein
MTLTEVQARVTKTASFTGSGIDVSGIVDGSGAVKDWTLKVQVEALSDAVAATTPVVRFAFEDTVNDYTASMAGPTISFKGTLAKSYDKVKTFKRQDFPDLRIGIASAQLRLKLSNLESGGSCTYRAWLEY